MMRPASLALLPNIHSVSQVFRVLWQATLVMAVVLFVVPCTAQEQEMISPYSITPVVLPGDAVTEATTPLASAAFPTSTDPALALASLSLWPVLILLAGIVCGMGIFYMGILPRLRHPVPTPSNPPAQTLPDAQGENDRQRLMLGAVSEAILVVDATGHIVSVNQGMLRILGIQSEAEALGTHLTQFLDQHQSGAEADAASHLVEACEQGEEANIPLCAMHKKDGTPFMASVKSNPVHADGHLSGSVLVFLDVTDLHALEAVRQAVFSASTDAYMIFDDQGQLEDINPAALALFKVSAQQDFSHRGLEAFFPHEQPDGKRSGPFIQDMLDQALHTGNSHAEIVLMDETGQLIPTEVTLVKVDMGYRNAIFANIHDLRMFRQAEEAINGERQRLQILLDNAPVGVAIFGVGTVKWANSKAVELAGVETGSDHIPLFIRGKDTLTLAELLERHGAIDNMEVQIEGPDGRRNIYLTALLTEFDGNPACLAWMVDITPLKRTEKALKEAHFAAETANRAKNDFLARMGHEIRTPMNAILGMGYLCLQTKLTNKQRDYLNKIQEAAQVLLSVINDILDFSKVGSDLMALEKAPFHLETFLKSVNETMAPKAEKKGLSYSMHIDETMPKRVLGDTLRLSQVLQVLLGNAIKFTDTGTITLRVESMQEDEAMVEAHFMVSDTGIGMSEEIIDTLFLPFEQGDDSKTRRFGGTGLGLAICKSLVDLMGGTLWVESAEGKGSTFHLSLPLEKGHQAAAFGSLTDQRGEILIVDDVPSSVEVLAEQVIELGYRATTALSGLDALQLLEAAAKEGRYFSVVLLDWKMEGLDGMQTASLIRRALPPETAPRVVLVSAAAADVDTRALQQNGIHTCLSKPVSTETLKQILTDFQEAPSYREDIAEEAVPAPSEETATILGARVLLVEDNEINQEIALALLEDEGMNVEVANDGQEALTMVTQAPPGHYQLIFMDIQMPVMDGLEAATRLRKQGYEPEVLPIVAMTAHARESDRLQSMEAGMNDHITKPLDPTLLHDTLVKWIDPAAISSDSAPPKRANDNNQQEEIFYTATGQKVTLENGQLPELSVQAGLESVGGNQTLYAKLLRKFRESCQITDIEIREALAATDTEVAVRLAHTVKGVSASLGMIALSQVAATAERSLKAWQPGSPLNEELLDNFSEELHHALHAVNAYLGDDGKTTPLEESAPDAAPLSVSPNAVAKALPLLKQLVDNLEADWVEVLSAHEGVIALLKETASASDLYDLTVAVENFDVPQVKAAAEKLEQALIRSSSS